MPTRKNTLLLIIITITLCSCSGHEPATTTPEESLATMHVYETTTIAPETTAEITQPSQSQTEAAQTNLEPPQPSFSDDELAAMSLEHDPSSMFIDGFYLTGKTDDLRELVGDKTYDEIVARMKRFYESQDFYYHHPQCAIVKEVNTQLFKDRAYIYFVVDGIEGEAIMVYTYADEHFDVLQPF